MGVSDLIAQTFPGVPWTGESHIHRSLATNLEVPDYPKPYVIKAFKDQLIGETVWDMLQKNFGKGEWLITKEEFVATLLRDTWGHLKGEGSTKSPQMIKNPVTGNIFHRMMLIGNLVGGFRCWIDYRTDGGYVWGCRFRIEGHKPEEEEHTRRTIRHTAEEATTQVQQILDDIEIPEPPKPGKKVRIKQY